jgi:hypothetical protein
VDDDRPGTADELLAELRAAGLGPRQALAWVTNPTALLSGLVPGEAIADPRTAARARHAARRLIAQLGDRVPEGVRVTAATIREPGSYLVKLHFASTEGVATRLWDAEPYLWASRAHEVLVHDYAKFERLRVVDGTLSWPDGLSFAADFLFAESREHDSLGDP